MTTATSVKETTAPNLSGRIPELDGIRGVIAYGTYLFHEFVLGIFFRRIPWLYSWHDLGLSFCALVVSILFCRLSWVYFEKPLVKIGHRTSYEFGAARFPETAPAPAEGS